MYIRHVLGKSFGRIQMRPYNNNPWFTYFWHMYVCSVPTRPTRIGNRPTKPWILIAKARYRPWAPPDIRRRHKFESRSANSNRYPTTISFHAVFFQVSKSIWLQILQLLAISRSGTTCYCTSCYNVGFVSFKRTTTSPVRSAGWRGLK